MQRIAKLAQTDQYMRSHYLKCEGFDDLIKAGELISAFKHIKCNDRVTVINKASGNERDEADTDYYLLSMERYFKYPLEEHLSGSCKLI